MYYKKDCSEVNLDVVIFNQGTTIRAIDYIGPDFEYFEQHMPLKDYFAEGDPFLEDKEPVSGLRMFEGRLERHCSPTYYGDEYDEELVGDFQPLTEEERHAVSAEEFPWDPNLWFEEGETSFLDLRIPLRQLLEDFEELGDKTPVARGQELRAELAG